MARLVMLYVSSEALVVLTTPTADTRQGSKPTRGAHTGRSEVQLEKWGVGFRNDSDVEYAHCIIIPPFALQPLTLYDHHL
jgi:hypothetical protein